MEMESGPSLRRHWPLITAERGKSVFFIDINPGISTTIHLSTTTRRIMEIHIEMMEKKRENS